MIVTAGAGSRRNEALDVALFTRHRDISIYFLVETVASLLQRLTMIHFEDIVDVFVGCCCTNSASFRRFMLATLRGERRRRKDVASSGGRGGVRFSADHCCTGNVVAAIPKSG